MHMNISVPDELAAQVRRHGIAISAVCQRALSRELRQLRNAFALNDAVSRGGDWDEQCRAAMERAVGYHRMQELDFDDVSHLAALLRLAEEDAVHALRELAQDALDEAREIENPSEPQDERKPFRHVSLGYAFEAATIATAQLAAQRNHVRPSR